MKQNKIEGEMEPDQERYGGDRRRYGEMKLAFFYRARLLEGADNYEGTK